MSEISLDNLFVLVHWDVNKHISYVLILLFSYATKVKGNTKIICLYNYLTTLFFFCLTVKCVSKYNTYKIFKNNLPTPTEQIGLTMCPLAVR
jgi:hypothetical protein